MLLMNSWIYHIHTHIHRIRTTMVETRKLLNPGNNSYAFSSPLFPQFFFLINMFVKIKNSGAFLRTSNDRETQCIIIIILDSLPRSISRRSSRSKRYYTHLSFLSLGVIPVCLRMARKTPGGCEEVQRSPGALQIYLGH